MPYSHHRWGWHMAEDREEKLDEEEELPEEPEQEEELDFSEFKG